MLCAAAYGFLVSITFLFNNGNPTFERHPQTLPPSLYGSNSLTCPSNTSTMTSNTPIRIDMVTSRIAKARYACICVNLDVSTPLPHHIHKGSFLQSVHYENIPFLCLNCGKFGHITTSYHSSSSSPPASYPSTSPTTPCKSASQPPPWIRMIHLGLLSNDFMDYSDDLNRARNNPNPLSMNRTKAT